MILRSLFSVLMVVLALQVGASEVSDNELDCLAMTVVGEACGEGERGMELVAQSIIARVQSTRWFLKQDTICKVVQQGGEGKRTQFHGYWDMVNEKKTCDDDVIETAYEIAERVAQENDAGEGFLFFKAMDAPGSIGVSNLCQKLTHGRHYFYKKCDEDDNLIADTINAPGY